MYIVVAEIQKYSIREAVRTNPELPGPNLALPVFREFCDTRLI